MEGRDAHCFVLLTVNVFSCFVLFQASINDCIVKNWIEKLKQHWVVKKHTYWPTLQSRSFLRSPQTTWREHRLDKTRRLTVSK